VPLPAKVTEVSEFIGVNASTPIDSTLAGISIAVSVCAKENAFLPIDVSRLPASKVTEVSEDAVSNA
jgi:hypothetical protein